MISIVTRVMIHHVLEVESNYDISHVVNYFRGKMYESFLFHAWDINFHVYARISTRTSTSHAVNIISSVIFDLCIIIFFWI